MELIVLRAFTPSCLALSGLFRMKRIALEKSSSVSGLQRIPFSPLIIRERIPEIDEPIIGNPHAMASQRTAGPPSLMLGIITESAAA